MKNKTRLKIFKWTTVMLILTTGTYAIHLIIKYFNGTLNNLSVLNLFIIGGTSAIIMFRQYFELKKKGIVR